MAKDKLLCIYHGNCADGFAAAWVVRKAFGDEVEFHPGVYGQKPPDVTNRHVLMVDFSYKRPVLEEMGRKAKTIVILDHHKSAAEDLKGFDEVAPFSEWKGGVLDLVQNDEMPVAVLFDMDRSGAGITWDFFFPNTPRPMLINHVEDRDLWRFKLSYTREIQATLFSYPYDFTVWDGLIEKADTSEGINLLIDEGEAIERKHHKDIAELLEVTARSMLIGGHFVWAASLPYTMSSDAAHLLCKRNEPGPFGACYWDTKEGRVFSLRSLDGGMDVSKIAQMYGGGGHEHAAGFTLSYDLATHSAALLPERAGGK